MGLRLITAKEIMDKYGIYERQIFDLIYNNDNIKFYDQQGRIRGTCDNKGNFKPFNGKGLIVFEISLYFANTPRGLYDSLRPEAKRNIMMAGFSKDLTEEGLRYFLHNTEYIDQQRINLINQNVEDRTMKLTFIHDLIFDANEIEAIIEEVYPCIKSDSSIINKTWTEKNNVIQASDGIIPVNVPSDLWLKQTDKEVYKNLQNEGYPPSVIAYILFKKTEHKTTVAQLLYPKDEISNALKKIRALLEEAKQYSFTFLNK
ncbi:MAG: hypothetical protein LBH05_02785 [Deferribacteraceae bacterium]|jgi:hypothetical protein|nr:hypothetical protein [Deferribacteraceae bacterium]